MSANDPDKPEPPINFTPAEQAENQKNAALIQIRFQQQHPEITSNANADITKMIREEKIMYSNMGIAFAVNFIAALAKRGS